MFYIPETKEEITALIKEIADRALNTSGPNSVDKLDYLYTVALFEALLDK